MELLKADEGAVVAKTTAPIMGRVCTECAAFVTRLGRTEGVLCDAEQCPFPKLNHGVPVTPFEVPTTTSEVM